MHFHKLKKIKDGISRMVIWKQLKQKPYARWLISCVGKLGQMLFLVKAFDIPDSCLAAPIAL
jgi:hypothetical protein